MKLLSILNGIPRAKMAYVTATNDQYLLKVKLT